MCAARDGNLPWQHDRVEANYDDDSQSRVCDARHHWWGCAKGLKGPACETFEVANAWYSQYRYAPVPEARAGNYKSHHEYGRRLSTAKRRSLGVEFSEF